MTDAKPLPKSLHTVTVIVRVARLVRRLGGTGHADPAVAVATALETLGLTGNPDPHGLAAAAIKQLEKQP